MKVNRPSVVGKYTNDLVYQRLVPGVLEELRHRNPKDEHGHRKGKHHQLLTEDIGIPALDNHLRAATAFMRAASTWDGFYRSMQRAFPKLNTTRLLNFPEEAEDSV
ncbi:MAG: P63C domain-containing protein [Terriglobales bacterium]